jgi:hypothetical protein
MNILLLFKLWRYALIPGFLFAILRILAWPPSRARFDAIANSK